MSLVPIDELLKQCSSMYKLVIIAAKRAKELSEGAPRFVEADLKKVTSIALEEIRQGKILYKTAETEEAASKGKPKRRLAKEAPAPTAVGAQATGKKKKS